MFFGKSGIFNSTPKIELVGSYYIVTGVNVKAFESDLRVNFGTSVIFSRVINRVNATSFRIHQFFMVELLWILDHLVSQTNKRTVNRYYVGIHKYKQLFDAIKQDSWLKTTQEEHPQYDLNKALSNFHGKMFEGQQKFLEGYAKIKYGYQLRGCLLDAVAGSGKSKTALVWAKMISNGKLFILVPKGLVEDPWVKEINKWYKNPPKVWTSLDGTDILNHTDAEIFIIHKEQIRSQDWTLAIKTITKNGTVPAKVVVDESHNYNEPKSAQTIKLIEFCSNKFISDVLLQSGTPIKAQGREAFALFVIIDKFFDKYVRDDFLKMYGRDNLFLNEMLAHRLGRIKFTIPQISKEMATPPTPHVIKVKFPGAEKFTLRQLRLDMLDYISERVKFYREVLPTYHQDWKEYVADFEQRYWKDEEVRAEIVRYREIVKKFQTSGFNNFEDAPLSKYCSMVEKKLEAHLRGDDLKYFRHIKSAVKYVDLKIRGEALGNVLGKARMEAIKQTIEHAQLPKLINAVVKKTLVYTSYIEVITELTKYFERNGLKSMELHGGNSSDIDKIIGKFGTDPEINPLITTFDTLKEGKPMLMANQIIMMNAPFRSYEQVQTIARIYRQGQDVECFVYQIDLDTGSEENITSRSIDIMEWSREQVDQLLGGGKLFIVNQKSERVGYVAGMEHNLPGELPTMMEDLDIETTEFVERPTKAFNPGTFVDLF